MRRTAETLGAFLLALGARTSLAAMPPTAPRDAALEAELGRIAASAGGPVGVTAVHVESGTHARLRDREPFKMASVFKLPIAIEILARADRGGLALDRPVVISAPDLSPGHSPIADAAPNGGVSFSVRELFERMLATSDNTAGDVLLRLAGGPEGVSARMRALGVPGIRIDRSEAELAFDYFGIDQAPGPSDFSRARFVALAGAVPAPRRRQAAARFSADPRDTAIPADMAALLVRLARRDVGLSAGATDRLLAGLASSRTGLHRIRGHLPPGTPVADKTGTYGAGPITAATNDVGIVTLPRGAGHIAIAIFLRDSPRPEAEREDVIARIARAAYDRFSRPDATPGPGRAPSARSASIRSRRAARLART